jgi:exonuclease SbcC
MKFNSVEISGFRIYDDPRNANFNFTTNGGETADFVSLFAPNGFGKTSFYDAVEWAVTDNIERFWVNNKNTEKSLSMLRQLSSKQIKLLKNHQTTNDTWVKIIDSEKKEFKHKYLNVSAQRAYDINKHDSEKEDIDFLKVILSQESISRFLKESNGQTRYKLFMENNAGLREVDIYYQSVIALSKANSKKISTIKADIKNLESQIDDTFKDDLLGPINVQIDELNGLLLKGKLKKIKVTTSKKDIADLKNSLSDLIADNSQIKKVESLLANIKITEIGNESLFSQKRYFEAKDSLRQLRKIIEEISTNLKDFEKLGAAKNEINQKQSSRESITSSLRELKVIQAQLPAYIKIDSQIFKKKKEKKEKQLKINILEKDIEASKRKIIEDKDINKKNERQRLNLSQELEYVPKLKSDLEAIEKRLNISKKKVEAQRKKFNSSSAVLTNLEEKVADLLQVQQEFEMGQYSETSFDGNEDQIKNLNEVEKLDGKELNLRKELKNIQEKINSQDSLNQSLQEFIASGLAIVNKQETNTCPLCEHTYEAYSILADKIINNEALTASIKELLMEHSKKQDEIDTNWENRKEIIDRIRTFYINELDRLQSEIKVAREDSNDQEKLLSERNKEISTQSEKILDLTSKFNEESINEYEKNLKNQLNKILEEKWIGEKKSGETKNINQNLFSEQNQLDENIKLLDEEIEALKSNSDYSEIKKWEVKNNEGEEKILVFVNEKIKSQQLEITLLDNQLNSLRDTEKNLSAKVIKLNEHQLKDKLNETVSQESKIERKIDNFNNHLKTKLFIEPENIENISLQDLLKKMQIDARNELGRYEQFIIEVQKLQGYSENILPFLQSEKAKLDITAFKKELDFIKTEVGSLLTEEIEKTKNHLDKQIKAFFYENLINEIYGKIDPHPSFKKVKFIATFTDTTPSLDVYVKGSENDNDKNSLIPNLYFSTAQINILSLSIFLAVALNSKKYDCIFIDDPIQSMDSINVLSTIDLLRSIVVNSKKQIILSTHDENFHNLLKMKIPCKLFKSKFLELESFGKLRKV